LDPVSKGRRLMAHTKGSVSGKNRAIEFFIDDDGRFKWGKQSDETADDVLGAGDGKGGREARCLEDARKFLEEVLANGPMPSEKIKLRAADRGISNKTLWRAKTEMDIAASKSSGIDGGWFWRLR
jgi:hypothetical protein